MVVLTVLFIALFMRLGFWQIQRANQKKQMLVAEQSLAKQEPIRWTGGEALPIQYQRIRIKGYYLPEVFLLDNQHQQHQFGYDILSPVVLGDGAIIMVDRGWVLGDNSRRLFPKVDTPEQLIEIQGKVYFPNKNQWVLGENLEKKSAKLTIVEILDTKIFSQILQKKVYPFIIRLDKQQSHGFIREWPTVSMPPDRHLAYALQWFAMALVIFIIFVALNLKKKNEKTSH